MEVIRLSGYTEDEKLAIAQRYLVPKQIKNNGLKEGEIEVSEGALRDIVRYYTREAGVRSLEREISKFCRKVVKQAALEEHKGTVQINSRNIEKYLGIKRFRFGLAEENDHVGQVTGLAWTEVGGDLLTLEAAVVSGKGKLSITGQIGDVMQESAQASMTVVRSRAAMLGINPEFYRDNDIHIHVPEGGIPKDGPSAGVAALTGIPVRANVAMTGEITLRGEVLPIGGLKEKLLAAHRGGIEIVLIPEENKRDLEEIPNNIKQKLDIRPVKWIDEVFAVALQHIPKPLSEDEVQKLLSKRTAGVKNKGDQLRAH